MTTSSETLVLVDPPAEEVLSLEDCKAKLGISGTSQDDLISGSLAAAVASLDGNFQFALALKSQIWELRLDRFPECNEVITLPLRPLIEVASVKYDDADGDEQTLTEGTDYISAGIGATSFGKIRPAYGQSWPTARCISESVRIQFVCGWEDDVPENIKQAIVLMVRKQMNTAAQNVFLTQDLVVGVGQKQYAASSQVGQIMDGAILSLLTPYIQMPV